MKSSISTRHTLTIEDLTNQEIKSILSILVMADSDLKQLDLQEKGTLKQMISIFNDAASNLPKF